MKSNKNFIKKALFLCAALAFFVGCSPDSDTSSEIESLDLTAIINPDTAKAAAEFDNTSNGIYKGVLVSADMAYHGVLTVNVGNDSRYNAILEYGTNRSQTIGFVGINSESEKTSNVFEFRGSNGGFTLDVSDYEQPVVTEGYMDGQIIQVTLLKETSVNPVRAALGTYVDDNDPTWEGTWDLLSNTTRAIPSGCGPTPIIVNEIAAIVLVHRGIRTFIDTNIVPFDGTAPIFATIPAFESGPSIVPYFTDPQIVPCDFLAPLSIGSDIYAGGQTAPNCGGQSTDWAIIVCPDAGSFDISGNSIPTPVYDREITGSGSIMFN